MKTQENKFWLVWCPLLSSKQFEERHPTYPLAITEAERVARENPGYEVFVLGAETSTCSVAMHRVEYIDPVDRRYVDPVDGLPV
jgi:hypothetical protein